MRVTNVSMMMMMMMMMIALLHCYCFSVFYCSKYINKVYPDRSTFGRMAAEENLF